MILRSIDFGHVFNASGARGFFGEGYWFHRFWKPFGLDYGGATFVAKTTTYFPKLGNMSIDEQFRPRDLRPDCIVVKPFSGVVLNAVGLSGPGVEVLLDRWCALDVARPFLVSFMAAGPDEKARQKEAELFVSVAKRLVQAHPRRLGLQVNFSCPNVEHKVNKYRALADEISTILTVLSELEIPLLAKLNALTPLSTMFEACELHPFCDAIVVSNTIPWGQLPDQIDWQGLFGSKTSPLAQYGGGGLSGKPLLPIVADWVTRARELGIRKPIVAGGGILTARDALRLLDVGANAVELGSVSILRPWRVQGIISAVNRRLCE